MVVGGWRRPSPDTSSCHVGDRFRTCQFLFLLSSSRHCQLLWGNRNITVAAVHDRKISLARSRCRTGAGCVARTRSPSGRFVTFTYSIQSSLVTFGHTCGLFAHAAGSAPVACSPIRGRSPDEEGRHTRPLCRRADEGEENSLPLPALGAPSPRVLPGIRSFAWDEQALRCLVPAQLLHVSATWASATLHWSGWLGPVVEHINGEQVTCP